MKNDSEVRQLIESLIDAGMKDKHEIFTKVTEQLNVPRPVVRRIARDLRHTLMKKLDVLQSDSKQTMTIDEENQELTPFQKIQLDPDYKPWFKPNQVKFD